MPEPRGSFSFSIAKRILSALEHNGPTKKTNLAVSSRLNYRICMKYIAMLKLLGWIDVRTDKETFVTITPRGKEVNEKLIGFSESTSDIGVTDSKETIEPVDGPESRAVERVENESILVRTRRRPTDTGSGTKGSVMLVDDEPDVLLTFRSFLSPKGYNVECFSDPYSALQRVASQRSVYFDLIILDIRMPGMNGLQLYQSLTVMSPKSKFLFASSLDAGRELVTLLPGMSQEQVLQKPIDRTFFLSKVEETLER